MRRPAKAAEINRELAALRRAFNLAVQAGRLINRPHFPMLRERNTRRGFLDRDHIDSICAALKATETAEDGRKKAGELANVVRSRLLLGGARHPKCYPSNGGTSIGRGAASDWTRTRRRTTKAAPSRSRPTSRRSSTSSWRFTAARDQQHDRPFVFQRNGERIDYFRAAWKNACRAAGCPGH
jgi:hypothetical protein